MTRWTAADLAKIEKARANIADGIASPLRSKFRAEPTMRGSIRFPSKLQASHYDELMLLQKAGHIRYFLREVSFDLPGRTKHRVDWMVVMPGCEPVLAESKGVDLALGKLKRQQVEEIYGMHILVWTRHVELPPSHRIGCCCITCRNKVM